MSGGWLLFQLSLKRLRGLLCATGLLLAVVQGLRVRIAAEVHDTGQFDHLTALMPSVVRQVVGPSLASIMSFNGLVCGVYFDTGFVIALLALTIAIATLPASEIETGFADLVLARPLPRHWLITRTIVLVLVSLLLMLLAIMAGTWVGLALCAPPDAPWPTARQLTPLALTLAMLILSWSGIAMTLGAAYRRGVAAATTGLLAFAAMLLDWAHRLWPPLDCIAWISPFSYFSPYELIAGDPLQVENLVVLGAIAATGYTAACFILSQRDIHR